MTAGDDTGPDGDTVSAGGDGGGAGGEEGGAGGDGAEASSVASANGAGTSADLPEAARRRLAGGAWTSGLSVTDFASCVDLGLEPVGLVQGYAVMQWSWFLSGGAYSGGLAPGGWWRTGTRTGQYVEEWRCPHGFVGTEHRMFGANYEQTWLEDSWANGWQLSRQRMVEEATALGAHGIIGVVDDMKHLVGGSTAEFRMSGTAVVATGADPPPEPFTTYLAGQRLAKLLEAGYVPVSVVATLSSVSMIGYCITHYQMAGTTAGNWYGAMSGGPAGVGPINQVDRAQLAARHLAREHIRRQLDGDLLHGVTLQQSEREVGEGDLSVECMLRGTRVRRYKEFDPLPEPEPVVRLS
ncbi:MAG: heavy metal-binding domain-containing protein [Acidimicrobiales bacterium]